MGSKLAVAAASLLAGAACAYPIRPPQPPSEPRERQRAEVAACSRGVLPAWLDDEAMNAAIEQDRREMRASVANDSFRGATFSAQPPAAMRPGSAAAVADDRRAFQQWCAALTARTRGLPGQAGGESPRPP